MFEKLLGIDLGTVNLLVYMKGRGIVLQEPSVVAIATRDSKIVAVGQEAADMLGRTPESIEVARPMRDGVIADYVVTGAMLRYFIRRTCGRNPLFKPRVMISTPKGVTSVESRAVHDATIEAGAREAYLIPEPLAAAYGAGLPIDTPTGNMVVDIGGGTTEAAVVSMYDIVVWSAIRIGGNRIDDSIVNYVRKKYNLLIGEQTAEEIKIKIGSAVMMPELMSMEVRGRDQVAGLPKTITITSEEVTEAITEPMQAIVGTVKATLEKTPPELAGDIYRNGVMLTGGGAQLHGLTEYLSQELKVEVTVSPDPVNCVALGTAQSLSIGDKLETGFTDATPRIGRR